MVRYATPQALAARCSTAVAICLAFGARRPVRLVCRYASSRLEKVFAYVRRPRATGRDCTVKRAADNGPTRAADRSRRGRVWPL